jgi:fumarate hydratase, class II
MMPLIAHNSLESVRMLSAGIDVFTRRCVDGIGADPQRCEQMIEQSLAMCTSLAPKIGYDQAAAIAKEAYADGKTVREVARLKGVLPEDELDGTLDPAAMTAPGAKGEGGG